MRSAKVLPFVLALAGSSFLAGDAAAYGQYSVNKDATNCRTCHGNFRDNAYISPVDSQNWGNLHDVHRQTMLSGDCDACHLANKFPVMMDSSAGGNGLSAIGCVGCHGRAEDDTNLNPDFPTVGGYGAGLRQKHTVANVTVCTQCHQDAVVNNYTPVGEDVLPPYYATPGVGHPNMPVNACNPNGSEDFAGDVDGLDNDGDGNYDGADGDCALGGAGGVGGAAGGAGGAGGAAGGAGGAAGGAGGAAGGAGGMTTSSSGTGGTTSGTGGMTSSGAGGTAGGAAAPEEDDGGCGCKLEGRPGGSNVPALSLFALIMLALRRRRRSA